MSVVTPSSHDTPTLRGWWLELNHGERHEFWSFIGGEGGPPEDLCGEALEKVLWQHLHSGAMW